MTTKNILIAACLLFLGNSLAQAGEPCLAKHFRTNLLEKKGIAISLTSVEDFITNVKGGLQKKSTWLGLLDTDMTVETEKAGLWPGGQFYLHGVNVHGNTKPTAELVGDLQGVNGNEAPRITRLLEFWYEHSWEKSGLSVLGGVHDMNSEFAASENGCLYLNGAFGLTPSMGSNVTVATYPYPALGTRLKWAPRDNFTLLMGAYDGNPGDDSDHPMTPDFSWNKKGGTFSIAEADFAYTFSKDKNPLPGSFKAGFWHHSLDFNDVTALDGDGNPIRHDDNYGGYAVIDQKIWTESEEQGLSMFILGGGAPQDRNTVDMHIASGFNYIGIIPGRDQDQAGLAFTYASISDKKQKNEALEGAETTIEGTYRIVLNDYVALQPDIQYVINPSGNPAIKNATVVTFRFEMSY